MFLDTPRIETTLEAFDELADVRMTLDGASLCALALSQGEMAEPAAAKLLSCLLGYCALVTDAACEVLYENHRELA